MMNRFVIADASKCIGCRTCEIACAMSHSDKSLGDMTTSQFTSRLKVIKTDTITMPVMCRQCDNAPCANACPTGALFRENDSIQVVQERCIGCRSCEVVCPFGAMTIQTQKTESDIQAKALKCDLCSDNPQGPACVRVCPTKAISLVYPDSLDDQIKQRQQQTALGQLNAFL